MFRWLIGLSLRFRFIVVGCAALLVLCGVIQLKKAPVDVFPEFMPLTVEVQTEALGLSANDIEDLITLNLEELLSAMPWLKSIRSESTTGLSSIVLTFEPGTDMLQARHMVQERLALKYALPNISLPPAMLQPISATSRFMMVGVSSEEIEATELSLEARWTIKPRLMGVPGVANVSIWGQQLRQMQVLFDPVRLRDAQLTQNDIIASAGDALWLTPLSFLRGSAPGTGGWIDNPNQRLGLHHDMPIISPETMAKVPVTPIHLLLTGKTISLGDVAETTFSHSMMIGDAFVDNGKGLLLVIEKLPSANTLEVTRGVEATLDELKLGMPGVKIDRNVFQLASYIKDSLFNLMIALLIGAVFLALVITFFGINPRGALISMIVIPLSLLAALVVLSLTGATLNTMILAGLVIALAVVIDDGVINVGNITERLQTGKSGDAASLEGVISATLLKTQGTTFYATLIVALAIMPVFFMGGVIGSFFVPLTWSALLAIVASLVVGLTVTPALCVVLLDENMPNGAGESPVVNWLQDRFTPLLKGAIESRRAVFGAISILVVVGALIGLFRAQSLLPSLQERTLRIHWATPPGTSHGESYRILSRVSRELRSLSGVLNVGAHLGRAVTGDDSSDVNAGQIWVDIDPNADYDDTVSAIRETINGYPGVDRDVQAYLRDTVSEVLTGEKAAVVVRTFGQDHEVLERTGEDIRHALSDIKGLVDLRAIGQTYTPQVNVKVDLDAASKVGIKPGDVRRSAATVFAGLTVGFLFDDQKIHDVLVWGAPETRQNIGQIQNLLVEKSDRHYVRLGDVANVSVIHAPTIIKHERISPYLDVIANVDGRDLGVVNREIEARLQKVVLPLEYHSEILGEYVERQEIQSRMRSLVLVALVGIFLLLQAALQSWRLASIAFLALPAAIAGGLLAAFLSGEMISLGSIVGLLAIVGIAARSSLLMMTHYQQLERQEGFHFDLNFILRGTGDQLSQVMTSSVAIFATLLPIVFFGNVPGLEIVRPMAIVIIGGVIVSTAVTLFAIPTLYWITGPIVRDRDADLDFSKV